MAMDVGGAKGGVKSDINVTPLVDVMLVLLIIMMLIAPMLQQGVAVTLPETVHRSDKPDTQDQTVVAVDAINHYYVNAIPVTKDDLVGRVTTALEAKNIQAVSTESEYVAGTHTELPEDKAEEVMKLVAALEDDDDVQNVYSNLG